MNQSYTAWYRLNQTIQKMPDMSCRILLLYEVRSWAVGLYQRDYPIGGEKCPKYACDNVTTNCD